MRLNGEAASLMDDWSCTNACPPHSDLQAALNTESSHDARDHTVPAHSIALSRVERVGQRRGCREKVIESDEDANATTPCRGTCQEGVIAFETSLTLVVAGIDCIAL